MIEEAYLLEIEAPTAIFIYREGEELGWMVLKADEKGHLSKEDLENERTIPGALDIEKLERYRWHPPSEERGHKDAKEYGWLDARGEDGEWVGASVEDYYALSPIRISLLTRNVREKDAA